MIRPKLPIIITLVLALTFCEKPERSVLIKTLDSVDTLITRTSATLKGEITDLGSKPIEDHGIILSVNSVPIHANSIAIKALGTISSVGVFQAHFDGLSVNLTYYFRSYVTVNSVISYGEIKQFKTKDYDLPAIITASLSSITNYSALSGGDIVGDGGDAITARGVCWSTTSNPTIADSKTSNGSGTGTFTSYLMNLNSNTTYFVRAYAVNIKGTGYGNELSFTTQSGTLLYDLEGNSYHTIIIGTQTWMQENLKTTKYNSGIDIPNVTDYTEWNNLTTGAFCWYNNDSASFNATYGALYNWYVASSNILCPVGWHVPSRNEWLILGANQSAGGGNYKEAGTIHWIAPNTATNITGFTGLPAGNRFFGNYSGMGYQAHWWASDGTWDTRLYSSSDIFELANDIEVQGFSIRCIKD